jgi:hypothetical protein
MGPYFDAGKTLIKDFYRYFLVDDELRKGTKKVITTHVSNCAFSKSSNLCHFFYLTVTFLYQLAVFYRSKDQRPQAQLYYQANLKLVYPLLRSSTSVNFCLFRAPPSEEKSRSTSFPFHPFSSKTARFSKPNESWTSHFKTVSISLPSSKPSSGTLPKPTPQLKRTPPSKGSENAPTPNSSKPSTL